jgi:hypothetical protein
MNEYDDGDFQESEVLHGSYYGYKVEFLLRVLNRIRNYDFPCSDGWKCEHKHSVHACSNMNVVECWTMWAREESDRYKGVRE